MRWVGERPAKKAGTGAMLSQRIGDRMDFALSAEQRELKEAAAAFAREKLGGGLGEREDAGEFSAEAWRAIYSRIFLLHLRRPQLMQRIPLQMVLT